MKREDHLKQLLQELATAKTKTEIRGVIQKADSTLNESRFTIIEKRTFFGEFILKAQTNSATMQNAAEAQEIVNQILSGGK